MEIASWEAMASGTIFQSARHRESLIHNESRSTLKIYLDAKRAPLVGEGNGRCSASRGGYQWFP